MTPSWTTEELTTYEQREKNLLDNQVVEEYKLYEATQKAQAKGREEGIEIGEAKGIEIGEAKGKEERNIEIARKLLSKEAAIEDIADITGLSLAQIKDIKKL